MYAYYYATGRYTALELFGDALILAKQVRRDAGRGSWDFLGMTRRGCVAWGFSSLAKTFSMPSR